ncbi:MAG: hypothetical protein LUG60_00645 [Erysipelotrichaceae bacterium]|nr:hypothetical protein [Erysipelotrichaceae bacterium]
MINIKDIADKADMIINGYAFTKDNDNIKVINLNHTECAAVLTKDAIVLETSMDDIELEIVCMYLKNNIQYLEEQ